MQLLHFLKTAHSFWIFCFVWLFLCFPLIFLFAFQFGKFLLTCYKLSGFSPLLCSSCWWIHQRHSSLSLHCFWFPAIPLDTFLRVSISLVTLSICPCMLSTFSVRVFYIVHLNFLSGNSKICVISESGSHAFSLDGSWAVFNVTVAVDFLQHPCFCPFCFLWVSLGTPP